METKADAGGAAAATCRVCGGEVSARGECVVCGTKQTESAPPTSTNGLAAWLKGESGANGLSSWMGAPVSPPAPDGREDALRKWLAGEDNAFQDWIGGPSAGGVSAAPSKGERVSEDKLRDLRAKALEAEGLKAELDAMRATVAKELANFRNGRFDPIEYIEEVADLSKKLQTEIAKRKELEQEIDHIKKGSIAVIKYVKGQQLKGGPALDLQKRVDAEVEAHRTLEVQIAELRAVNEALRDKLEVGLAKVKPSLRELEKRDVELTEREAALGAKEKMIPAALVGPAAPGAESGAASEELKRRFEEELRENEEDYLAKEEQL